ncbi:MAG: hypothetical protein E6Q88_07145 [Lysobacteraceae bacterium]|nr:MAG: hypothetical protein E6Q88_07145 [Xanthomonadaceae bacterium]
MPRSPTMFRITASSAAHLPAFLQVFLLLSLSVCLPLSLSASLPAHAAERIQPATMTEEDLVTYMPENAKIEVRLDEDVNGDGLRDLVFGARSEEARVLKVMLAFANEFELGFDPVGEMAMSDSPLGSAVLSVKKNVLIVEDLSGGTTAVQSLYRFRYDPGEGRMRLIGDDVSLYSRTNAHDSTSVSTNRLTGARTTTESEIKGEEYVDKPPVRSKVSSKPVYMEEAPLPEETLGLGE